VPTSRLTDMAALLAQRIKPGRRLSCLLAVGLLVTLPFSGSVEAQARGSGKRSSAGSTKTQAAKTIAPGSAGATAAQEQAPANLPTKGIDFQRQMVTVWGLGGTPWDSQPVLDEERLRAWMDALHHAYETILDLPLMEGLTVRQTIGANSAMKERLGLMLRSLEPLFYQRDATGLIRCRLDVPFTGGISLRSALYLAALRPSPSQPENFLASWATPPFPTPDGAAGSFGKEDPGMETPEGKQTSDASAPKPALKRIVFDLRRTLFRPSLFPRLFADTGQLVFQETMIPSPERFSRPVFRFTTDIAGAFQDLAAGEVLVAEGRIEPLGRHDITLGAADAPAVISFCQQLRDRPMARGEILIVYRDREDPRHGLFPKADSPKSDKGAPSSQRTGSSPSTMGQKR
jgi:hypothetical protein